MPEHGPPGTQYRRPTDAGGGHDRARGNGRVHKEHLTFSGDRADNIGQLMLTILGGIAEFERSLIQERQAEGIALAKERGIYKGRAGPYRRADGAELESAPARGGT